ncbi:serine/threonine-protein kinase [Pseudomarimonas arenosa]|uniref:non-specific serine/threonine protein kinase n=1 Tax=Pseudomarimonas arenosa TaxID=2774145 RepID=A0AAW3ZP35_9GAMM|nr:serine/threonine protein kinase [Pseudomarimonas arenosa]
MSATVLLKSVDIHIPGYKILRPLGEGGMASVFLAMQESLDREVALKVMAPALAANSEFTDRFLKEGRITAKLSHPNLVTVFDIGSHGSVYYLAAEYIPGGTLREKINLGLSIAETLDIVCDVARGLHFAHQKGFVHRDVKPGNILFKLDGTAVLADFGIAKAMDAKSGATMAGASIGTPDYMSPEQARAETVDGRSDLYSMGAMLYEMLTGEPPYQASDPFTVALMHVTQPVPQLPAESAWLQPLIDSLMAKTPENRPESGEAFIGEVEGLLASSPEAAGIQQRPGAKKKAGGPRLSGSTTRVSVATPSPLASPMVIGGGLAAVLAIAVAGYVLWPKADPTITTAPDPTSVDPSQLPPEVLIPSPTVPTDELDVGLLLEQADGFKQRGLEGRDGRYLTFPDDENAVALYKRVLDKEPGNERASSGLVEIRDFFERGARGLCDRQLYDPCITIAEKGLLADPDSQALKQLIEDANNKRLGN